MHVYNTPFVSQMGTGPPPSRGLGVHHQCFLALMVGAPRSPALASPRGATVDIFYVNSGRSRISVSTRQGVHHRCFLALIMGALGSLAPTPRRGATIDDFQR
jgi:hypothetical protein